MVGRVMWRAFGRGLRDLLDNLLPMTVASLAWWGTLLLIVTAPAGTLALFTFTDPNRLSEHLRPTTTELKARVRREFGPAWLLALCFGLPIVALVSNLTVYGGRWRSFGVLTDDVSLVANGLLDVREEPQGFRTASGTAAPCGP